MINDAAIPAAQYLRKSTEHQQYSLENQAAAIQDYAAKNGFSIVETYSDSGTGLVLKSRKGLRKMLEGIIEGRAAYKAILLYDFSRWGRVLDADESDYYEFICTSSGIQVHYCAEACSNDRTWSAFFSKP